MFKWLQILKINIPKERKLCPIINNKLIHLHILIYNLPYEHEHFIKEKYLFTSLIMFHTNIVQTKYKPFQRKKKVGLFTVLFFARWSGVRCGLPCCTKPTVTRTHCSQGKRSLCRNAMVCSAKNVENSMCHYCTVHNRQLWFNCPNYNQFDKCPQASSFYFIFSLRQGNHTTRQFHQGSLLAA